MSADKVSKSKWYQTLPFNWPLLTRLNVSRVFRLTAQNLFQNLRLELLLGLPLLFFVLWLDFRLIRSSWSPTLLIFGRFIGLWLQQDSKIGLYTEFRARKEEGRLLKETTWKKIRVQSLISISILRTPSKFVRYCYGWKCTNKQHTSPCLIIQPGKN